MHVKCQSVSVRLPLPIGEPLRLDGSSLSPSPQGRRSLVLKGGRPVAAGCGLWVPWVGGWSCLLRLETCPGVQNPKGNRPDKKALPKCRCSRGSEPPNSTHERGRGRNCMSASTHGGPGTPGTVAQAFRHHAGGTAAAVNDARSG